MEDPQPLNIDRALRFFRRRGIWIVVCMVLAGLAAYAISKSQQKKYTASAAVIFNENQLSQEIAGLPATATNTLSQNASNLDLLNLRNTAAKTAAKVGHGLTEKDVKEAVSINGNTESNIASVSATDASAALAAEIANAYARRFVREQNSANSAYFQSALSLVRKQIAALSPGARNGPPGVDLLARAHSLALLTKLQPNSVEVVQIATAPAGPSSPTTAKNTLIGLVLGLFLGFGIALLLERIDPRIRDPHELEELYGSRLLGTVPRSPRLAEYSVADGLGPLPMEAEAFQVIRAQLGSFNTGQNPGLVLISSAAAGEGKSTIAFHLAVAAAQTGSRVLLLEANFRRPSLAHRLGLADSPNLLEATVGLDAIEPTAGIPVASYAGEGSLSVLPAGKLDVHSPATVIDSSAMDRVLNAATAAYDLVVVDGPELTGISDAFLLTAKVDGLVVVGLNDRSRRDIARDLVQRLRASKVRIYGVVANRVGRSRRGMSRESAKVEVHQFDGGEIGSDSTSAEGDPVPGAGVPT